MILMNITLLNPENGYKSVLAGSTGNIIKFKAETLDNNNTPQGESMTITFKVKTEGGVENTYTAIYDGNIASQGIDYNLDGKLGNGVNTITITAVGMNTGISAMRRITYRVIDMYFKDKLQLKLFILFLFFGLITLLFVQKLIILGWYIALMIFVFVVYFAINIMVNKKRGK